jgi:hypothetical protein
MDDGFKEGLPWIFYQNNGNSRSGTEILQMSNRVKFRASFDFENKELGIMSSLKFKLAQYDIYGNYVGFEYLND